MPVDEKMVKFDGKVKMVVKMQNSDGKDAANRMEENSRNNEEMPQRTKKKERWSLCGEGIHKAKKNEYQFPHHGSKTLYDGCHGPKSKNEGIRFCDMADWRKPIAHHHELLGRVHPKPRPPDI